MAFAKADTDRRFVFIIQRGAADGLGTIGAVGDPAFAGARGQLAADFARREEARQHVRAASGDDLAGAAMYDAKEALFAHAIASPYRDRSHFDGQNVLESGGLGAYQVKDGWLNRMLGLIPSGEAKAIAVSATVPLALRGPHECQQLCALGAARRRPTICCSGSRRSIRATASSTRCGARR